MTESVLALTQHSRGKIVFEADTVKGRAVSIDKGVGHAGIHCTWMKDGCKVVLQLMPTYRVCLERYISRQPSCLGLDSQTN